MNGSAECFVLLDDSTSSSLSKSSRLYSGLHKILECDSATSFTSILDEMMQETQKGRYAVGCFTYELGAEMIGVTPRPKTGLLAEIMLFNRCEFLSVDEVSAWLASKCRAVAEEAGFSTEVPSGVIKVRKSVAEEGFFAAISKIRELLESGDTYQVNYTYRLGFEAYGDPCALYRRLRKRQPVPYGALLSLPDGRVIMSFSPELFLRHERGRLTARPMKGTAPASLDEDENARRALELVTDPKSIAENVMIVDLLRNDLGRIAVSGTVSVPQLFDVNRFGDVLQMTSTVLADRNENVTLSDVFDAVYPCGSITGAPKRRTMQIIRELEDTPRGIYTGAIGWFDPPAPQQHIGDFCLSVPIRTMELQPPANAGLRAGTMGVGAGIVYDSIAADEAQECQLKSGFLINMPHEFDLIETMHASARDGIRHLRAHFARLKHSATTFGFVFDEAKVISLLQSSCARLPSGIHRMRLSLTPEGTCSVRSEPVEPIVEPVRVIVAKKSNPYGGILVGHKTTWRKHYDQAVYTAQQCGAFDMLLYNEDGLLTEGGRSNVFLKLGGRWHTPALTLGVLPGVMRTMLLKDPRWNASESALAVDELQRAECIMVCNALHGPLVATLIT